MDKPRIYVDFNEMLDDDIVLLSKNDTKIDSAGNIITFYEGMPVSIYMDDVDCDGKEDNLIAEGIVIKPDLNKYPWSKHVKWCCRFILVTLNICHRQMFSVTAYTAVKNWKQQLISFASIIEIVG